MWVHIQQKQIYEKRNLFFRLEQQFSLETSYWIFLHTCSQPTSTRKDVSLYRCCKGFGYRQGSVRSHKISLAGQPRYPKNYLGWTKIRVLFFLEIFRRNTVSI